MLSWFLSELWPFNNFSVVSPVSATSLAVFVSPVKQKRDICIAFPASSLSAAAA